MRRLRLTGPQQSAIECRDCDGFEMDGGYLVVRDARTSWSMLVDAANAEDDYAEDANNPSDLRAFARRAGRSLTAVSRRVSRMIDG